MRRITAIALAAALGLSACASDGASSTIEANAGVDFEVEVGVAPVFDGCDMTRDVTNFAWTIVDAPETQADSDGKVLREVQSDCTFQLESAMVIGDVGEWTIELLATGSEGESTDQVVVTVTE